MKNPTKTLEEVTKALEVCTSDHGGCEGCPYDPDCTPDYKWDDAIFYLKEYKCKREQLDIEIEKYQEAVKNCERAEHKYMAEYQKQHEQQTLYLAENTKDNPPLTWDELKAMEGKPVWICCGNECDNHDLWGGMWRIISTFTGRNDELACMTTLEKYPDSFWKKSMGKTWQAYRKERR